MVRGALVVVIPAQAGIQTDLLEACIRGHDDAAWMPAVARMTMLPGCPPSRA
jgi:hypothetical protein